MKSCLKCSSASSSFGSASSSSPCAFAGSSCASADRAPSCSNTKGSARPACSRQVSFRDKCEFEYHTADDWDRSPVDITPKLSYEDILELKQMQVDAARAQARQHGTSSRFLPKVPLSVMPLLPTSGSNSSVISKPPNGNSASAPRIPTPMAVGLALQEACLCRMLSADSGTSRSERCAIHGAAARKAADRNSSPQSRHHIPSPPHTPPRRPVASLPSIASSPPPPPPKRMKNFAFVPLVASSSSGSESGSGKKETDTKHGLITPPLSAKPSWTQLAPEQQTHARSGYNANFSLVGDTSSLGLGLERKLGFSLGSSDSSTESDTEPESEVSSGEDETDWRLKELRTQQLKQRKQRMSPPPRRTFRTFTRLC